ncbi:MAG: hypothetical protein SFV54_11885 [Bryobacteraceae bacterium]|nr:hypothetical protein [Bryobacteraceae bacterium]
MGARTEIPGDLRTCASFELGEAALSATTPRKTATFRDPAALEILQALSKALQEKEGYRCGEAKPAKGIDAGTSCQLGEHCNISLLLGVSGRGESVVRFDLITDWYPPLLGRLIGRPAQLEPECLRRWEALLTAINRQLENALGAKQVVWLTSATASDRWAKREA